MKGLDKIGEWSIERICFELERYNGWGYRKYHPSTLSPYLWSGTTHYARGKYVADGKWSATAVSGQSGALALLKRIEELEHSVVLRGDGDIGIPISAPDVPIAANLEFPKAESKVSVAEVIALVTRSRSLWAMIQATVLAIVSAFTSWLNDAAEFVFDWALWLVNLLPVLTTEVGQSIASGRQMAAWLGIDWSKVGIGMAVACLSVAFIRHFLLKKDSQS